MKVVTDVICEDFKVHLFDTIGHFSYIQYEHRTYVSFQMSTVGIVTLNCQLDLESFEQMKLSIQTFSTRNSLSVWVALDVLTVKEGK